MEKTALLKPEWAPHNRGGFLPRRTFYAVCLWFVALAPVWGDINLAALDQLSPAERYRQLNLMVMVSAGISHVFVEQLLPRQPPGAEAGAPEELVPLLAIEDFQTPLNRIVDQRQMIARAARVFRYTLDHRPDIERELVEIAASYPEQVAEVNLIQLAEEAIIIRSALAGSIEYLASEGDSAMAANLEPYQQRTIYLRDVMEYWKFDKELVAITENAIRDTGGKMAAYQRMLEDEPNLEGFKQHLQAVEAIYKNTQPLKVKKKDLESKELIESESEVH